MLEYKCDWCGRQKKPQDTWVLGLAVERKGVTGNRRHFETLVRWSAKWASHPMAVHFCCEQHKEKYLEALFASPWAAVDRDALARAAHQRRLGQGRKVKDDSGMASEWHIEAEPAQAKRQPQKKKRAPSPRKPKPPAIVFSEVDKLHARALGIVLDADDRRTERDADFPKDE